MSFASRTPSRMTCQSSSSYFQSTTASNSPDHISALDNDDEPEIPEPSYRRPVQYTPSVATTRSSTARTTISRATTRPSTASGRKSRTGTTPSILGLSESHSIVCAVNEARGVSPSVGIALVNVSLGEVTLSQICDNQSYVKTIHKIQMASPSRIIFTSTACPPNKPSTLYSLVQELIPEAQTAPFDRSAWSESAGLDYIQNLAFQSDVEPIKVAIQGKIHLLTDAIPGDEVYRTPFYYQLRPHSFRVRYQPSDDTMMIDISAIQSLEIMQNMRASKSKDSLFGLLNHTATPMGSRMLRSNILQPPTRYDSFIKPRYDALEELATNEEMFGEIRKALKLFQDVEKLLTKLITISTATAVSEVEEQITQVLMIKGFLESVPELFRALGPARSALLVKIRDLCRPEITVPILSYIRKVIEPDVTYMKSPLDLRNQRTFAVKAGISGMLDVARQTYKELTEAIHQHVDEINEKYRLNASLKFDNGRKYWLRLRVADLDDASLPQVLINVVRKRDCIECQTLSLVKLNHRLSDTSNEVVLRSDTVIQSLVKELREEVPHLFRVCESVALVDMIASFGQLATTRDYVRPEVTDTLALKAARHPILDKNLSTHFVPNDYYATEQYCFHIVTGCNMSGKSTYIRTVALLQIMAQIGSFVPAEYAAFPIIHNIFARVSMEDNIEASLSTFSVEMREMAFILRNVDDKSLAIIDELGRGTSTRDGLSIAIAMSEALIDSKASVWFATHFVELARVLADRPGVLNLHLASGSSTTKDGLPHLTMLYKATAGTVDDDQHYGIHLARAMGMPASFIEMAEDVANDLRQKRESNRQSSESRKLLARRKLILNLHEALQHALSSGSEEALPRYLERLQEEFIVRMEEIDSTQVRRGLLSRAESS